MNDKTMQVNQVFKTYDYSIFKQIDGNRNVNEANVNRLIKSMEYELLQVPIIINEHYEIIDGQHRFIACQKTKNPVYFIIVRGYSLSQVYRLNAISKKWSLYDYLDAYCNAGIKDYVIAKEFIEKYQFGTMETLGMLLDYKGLAGSDDKNKFHNGGFKIKDLFKAELTAEKINKIGGFYKGHKRRNFVAAMLRLFDNKEFDFDFFISKLQVNQTMMVDCSTIDQYIQIIEDIYNYRARQKVRFY